MRELEAGDHGVASFVRSIHIDKCLHYVIWASSGGEALFCLEGAEVRLRGLRLGSPRLTSGDGYWRGMNGSRLPL